MLEHIEHDVLSWSKPLWMKSSAVTRALLSDRLPSSQALVKLMPITRPQARRRWSLSLMVVLLLHWSFGACAALADTICLEPTGQVAYEKAGEPCAAEARAQTTGKSCIDLPAQDGHDDHSSVPSKLQLADLQIPHLIPALIWLLPGTPAHHAVKPDATGPPTTPFSVIIRETAYLLI